LLNQYQLVGNENKKTSLFRRNKNAEVTDKQQRVSSDMTLIRYALYEVVSARKESGDVLTAIHSIEKEALG